MAEDERVKGILLNCEYLMREALLNNRVDMFPKCTKLGSYETQLELLIDVWNRIKQALKGGINMSEEEANALKGDSAITRYGHPRFYELLEELANLHSQKNHDYAGVEEPLANLKECKRIGVDPFIGCFIRMQDKYMRLCNLIQRPPQVHDENKRDTLIDLAIYALLGIILLEEASERTVWHDHFCTQCQLSYLDDTIYNSACPKCKSNTCIRERNHK